MSEESLAPARLAAESGQFDPSVFEKAKKECLVSLLNRAYPNFIKNLK